MNETEQDKNLKSVDDFRMFDDTFMSAVFDGKIEETQFLIRVILGRDDIIVIESKAQFFISNIYGRGLRLDIFARDEGGNTYHFEVERSKERASAKRARFTGAMVDSRLLRRGQDVKEIPDRYTIFISEEDAFSEGLPIYHAVYKITELQDRLLGDGSQIIYVNGEYRNPDTPIGQLMHDFSCKKADDILSPILRERVRVLKETEGGRQEVCQIMENRINEEKIELAKEAIQKGNLTLEQIADVLKLPLAFVQELAKSTPAYAV
jgi:predicted HTH domain antitoxin